MTNPTKPASGGPKKNQPGKGTAGSTAMSKGTAGSTAAGTGAARTAPHRAQSKKIVNQRQTPWGLIIATVLIVLLAVGVIGYAVNQNRSKADYANPDKIPGITHKVFTGGDHKAGVIAYTESPPFGGPHSPIWADCTGTVYPSQIASENAVHDLEHGAVWVAYDPGIDEAQLTALSALVAQQAKVTATPLEGLESALVVSAWARQLPLESVDDPRLVQFIETYRNSDNAPEPGAACQGVGEPAVAAPAA
jgi:hypothetical protein